MRRLTLSVLVALLVTLTVTTASAKDSVWSALVMANNRPEPTPIPAELNKLESTLKQLFGYNQYQVIGQSRHTMNGEQDWSTSSKYFSLHVDSKSATKSAYQLNLQLLQEQKVLLETEAKLSKPRPLVIRGPQVGDGQLVLLLVLE